MPPTIYNGALYFPREADPAGKFMAAFLAGQSQLRQRQQLELEREDRMLRRDEFKQQARALDMEQKRLDLDSKRSLFTSKSGTFGGFDSFMSEIEAPVPGMDTQLGEGGVEDMGTELLGRYSTPVERQHDYIDGIGQPENMSQYLMRKALEGGVAATADIAKGMRPVPSELRARFGLDQGTDQIHQDVLARAGERIEVPEDMFPARHPLGQVGGGGMYESPVIQAAQQTYGEDEATRRNAASNATQLAVSKNYASRFGGEGAAANDPRLPTIARQVASGEISYQAGASALGGVRSKGGAALSAALESMNARVLTPDMRKATTNLQKVEGVIDMIEGQFQKVVNAASFEDRAKESLILESLGTSLSSVMAKSGFMESGVLTEGDIGRAKGLIPGWKAANFSPDYGNREIAALRGITAKMEQSLFQGGFKNVPINANSPVVAAGSPASPTNEATKGANLQATIDAKVAKVPPAFRSGIHVNRQTGQVGYLRGGQWIEVQ